MSALREAANRALVEALRELLDAGDTYRLNSEDHDALDRNAKRFAGVRDKARRVLASYTMEAK